MSNVSLFESTLEFKNSIYKIYSVDLDRHPSYYSFVKDEIETKEYLWNIYPGDYILDIGASYGSYTLTALAIFNTSWLLLNKI